jgi:ABC-type glycerol-3-phosphate transport system substrate-binding protein
MSTDFFKRSDEMVVFKRAGLVAALLVAAGSLQDAAAEEPSAEPVYQVVSPTGERDAKVAAMAPRLDTLAGKTVCLVWNASFKSDVTLPAIAEALKEQYPGIKIVPYNAMPLAPLPEPAGTPRNESEALQAAFKAKGCDAVIAGNGG